MSRRGQISGLHPHQHLYVAHPFTGELRKRLTEILVDEGCCCEEQHDFRCDATSLNCLASHCLSTLESLELMVKDEMADR